MLSGSITALVTPFKKDGAFDEANFIKHINWQLQNGTNGFVPVGTTGESPTLSHDEHKNVIETCVKAVNKKVPVIAGTGSNNTDEAIDFIEHATSVGADAALVVTPYYNKPTQEGMYQHFKKALAIQDKLIPLHKALFLETSPAPVKYALSLLDYCEDVVRLPLVSVTSETQVAVRDAMIYAGIL